jgi:hypothetical protein
MAKPRLRNVPSNGSLFPLLFSQVVTTGGYYYPVKIYHGSEIDKKIQRYCIQEGVSIEQCALRAIGKFLPSSKWLDEK